MEPRVIGLLLSPATDASIYRAVLARAAMNAELIEGLTPSTLGRVAALVVDATRPDATALAREAESAGVPWVLADPRKSADPGNALAGYTVQALAAAAYAHGTDRLIEALAYAMAPYPRPKHAERRLRYLGQTGAPPVGVPIGQLYRLPHRAVTALGRMSETFPVPRADWMAANHLLINASPEGIDVRDDATTNGTTLLRRGALTRLGRDPVRLDADDELVLAQVYRFRYDVG